MSTRWRERFGNRIRHLRRSRNLTQEALAERSEISVDAIRRIEGARLSPSLETLVKITTGLEISLPTLFEDIDGERPTLVNEFCDYLGHRSPNELKIAWRVIHALFEDWEGRA